MSPYIQPIIYICIALNPIKKLASQTVIYGIPSIGGRFINFLLTYLYTRIFLREQYGVISEFYAYSGFFTVLLTFGMETAFFRFQQKSEQPQKIYSTALNFIIGTSLIFFLLVYLFSQPIADKLRFPDHAEYVRWFAIILILDSISAIPFAKLRADNKAIRFAIIKILEIAISILLTIFILIFCRSAFIHHPDSTLAKFYNPNLGVGYIFIINIAASAVKMLLLSPQLLGAIHGFSRALFRQMIRYSLPMVIIGFSYIINEMLDRMILPYFLPHDNVTNLKLLGEYSACYRLSIIMSLFSQAFRYAGEPFFFAHSAKENAKQLYADVTKYFAIFCVFVFLLVMLNLNWIQLFIGKPFRAGLAVVPILLMANLCLGLYTNLSIWYKLTDRTLLGSAISVGSALITIVLNVAFIPVYGYMACSL